MIEVYHAHRPCYIPEKDAEYTKIAEVETDSLEEAFKLTNSTDKPWYENEKVKVIEKSRSTSVGDMMKKKGKKFSVDIFGFREIK